MKPGKWAKLLFVAAPLLIGFGAGCGDFWQAPNTGTGGCTTNCTTASSNNFYILDAGNSPGIVGNSIVSGKLTPISGSSWPLAGGGLPYSMAIDPAGNFLIVSGTSGVYSYPITNGTLGTGVQVTSDQAGAVQVDATSSWLIEAIAATGGVTMGAVPIDPTTGAGNGTELNVSVSNITNASLQSNQMAISGDNVNIFVALGTGGAIVVPFNPSAATGVNPFGSQATEIPVTNTGGSALSVAVDPGATPRLFYIGEAEGDTAGNSGGLRVCSYSSLGCSKTTQATGSPIASGGLAPKFILPDSTGKYVYVANGQGQTAAGNISGFTITASSATPPVYTIATDTTTAAGAQPLGMAEDSSNTFVFEVGSAGSPYFDAYTFDATTLGQLDSQIGSTTEGNAVAIIAAPQ